MSEMPKPTEAHQKLKRLAGVWEGKEMLSPSPWGPGGEATGKYTGRIDLDGFFLIQDYVEEKDGKVAFRGHGIFGWDPGDQKFTWYWVDSMGGVPSAPSRGEWNGDTLTFESSSPQGKGRYTYRFEGDSAYNFRLENSFDGGKTFTLLMEGTYHRK
ncbi:MAG TPA: DUF1579 family protein [Polyangia bacterium]|jgi:hypothetical protein|nr:DUF1579 family protein [Polyangia bacterium]